MTLFRAFPRDEIITRGEIRAIARRLKQIAAKRSNVPSVLIAFAHCEMSSVESRDEKREAALSPLDDVVHPAVALCAKRLKILCTQSTELEKSSRILRRSKQSHAVNHASNLGKLHLKWQPLRWRGKILPMEILSRIPQSLKA